ncbi:ppilus assembly protein [Bifidobacterium goeldii]|uniref:Ppilus assembly protein n=2 Tax=Bifidobacterium goeldii TaxID=2306975 RepID=A0A430FLC7_9BIFI|nr:ppilus assembly protein [Bifidobacterium goeldii]
MNMSDMPLVAAIATMLWLLLCRMKPVRRLIGDRSVFDSDNAGSPADHVGIAAVIAAVNAHVRAGGNAVDEFERHMGHAFATNTLTYSRIRAVLMKRRREGENDRQVAVIAAELAAACALSDRTGCSLAHCLDVVGADHRRLRMLADLRRSAFAVPQATVVLLSILPLGAVLLGELFGADPLRFLFGTVQGNACLVVGCFAYVLGVSWMTVMMRDTQG